jgi:hypothetical protein
LPPTIKSRSPAPGTSPGIDRRWRYPDRYVAFAADTVIAFAMVPEEAVKPSSLRCGVEPHGSLGR